MARRPRVVLPGQPVHVVHRGNDRQAVFYSSGDRVRYLADLAEAARRIDCLIHAYVLMSNHTHLVATPGTSDGLGKMMQPLGRRCVRFINSEYGRTGTLWEGRYKSALIDSETYLLHCYRYVELNPVRAGLVTQASDYVWSSYRYNALGDADSLITPHDVYRRLGRTAANRQRAYRDIHDGATGGAELKVIRQSTEQDSIIGNDRFRELIEVILDRKLRLQNHGGDRRSKRFQVH